MQAAKLICTPLVYMVYIQRYQALATSSKAAPQGRPKGNLGPYLVSMPLSRIFLMFFFVFFPDSTYKIGFSLAKLKAKSD